MYLCSLSKKIVYLLQGRTALHWAVLFDKVRIGHELILGQASVTIIDNEGLSPMHIAIEQKHKEFVEMLCQLGPKQVIILF